MSTSKPPEAEQGRVGNIHIDPGTVEIVKLHFDDLRGRSAQAPAAEMGTPDSSEEPTLRFDFSAGRIAEDAIVVALQLLIEAPETASLIVAAKTRITVTIPEDAALDVDDELAKIASQMGPVIIYPYLREVIADVTRRAGMSPLTLPIYQIGTFFKVDPKSLALPASPKQKNKPAKKALSTTSRKKKAAKG